MAGASTQTTDVARPARLDASSGGPPSGDYPRFGYRWTIVALLFFATSISYIDRQVLGILAPTLQRELHWTETDYGAIVSWFSFAYGIGLLFMGRIIDRVGERRGLSASIVVWSVAAMATAKAGTIAAFGAARALLGLGESGNFPAALKAVSEWFPQRERALAVGVFNAGSNVGAVIAPIAVPWIALTWGWRASFVATGTLGFIWLACWLWVYRAPESSKRLSARELAYIRSDPVVPAERQSWRQLLSCRQAWAFAVGKALTDPIWLFYLFWLPKFLDTNYGVKLSGVAAPLVVIYTVADVGSVAGGYVSSALVSRGWSVNAARKTTMLIAALLIVPTAFAPFAHGMWMAVGIVAVAAAAHQWWSANLFTTASDLFPREAVASVVGFGGFAGAIAGVVFQRATGIILDATHGRYGVIFAICGSAYLVALLCVHLIVPRMEPVRSAR